MLLLPVRTTVFGHNISPSGVSVPTDRVAAITEMSRPTNPAGLRRFMGMTGFYRRMVPSFSNIVFPLSEMLRLQQQSSSLEWNESAVAAFEAIKHALSHAVTLSHPHPASSTYHIVTDASSTAVGTALHQVVEGKTRPLAFFSKKLSDSQQRYSTYDRELLAAYLAVLQFRHIIEGGHTTLFTDHKPLTTAFYSQRPAKSDRQQRHLSFITEYVADVEYVCGADNIVADCLSRPVLSVQVDVTDLPAIAAAQSTDPETLASTHRLKPFPLTDGTQLLCDTSTPQPRPFVPVACRFALFQQLHSMSHPGMQSSVRLLKARYYWPTLERDVKAWVRTCLRCQEAKVIRHTHLQLHNFALRRVVSKLCT